jgi:hypothetical protein
MLGVKTAEEIELKEVVVAVAENKLVAVVVGTAELLDGGDADVVGDETGEELEDVGVRVGVGVGVVDALMVAVVGCGDDVTEAAAGGVGELFSQKLMNFTRGVTKATAGELIGVAL